MSHTVPNWDSDDVSALPRFHLRSHLSDSGNVPLVGYEMEELAWEKGGLIVNGLGLMRVSSQSSLEPNPYTAPKDDTWEKPRAAVGTLESIVDLARGNRPPASKGVDDNHVPVKPPITRHRDLPELTAVASDMDLVVPCGIIPNKEPRSSTCVAGGSTRVELEEGSVRKKAKTWPTPTRVPLTGECSVQQSQSGGGESWHVREADTCENGSGGLGLTTASFYTQGGTMSLSSNELPSSTNDSACLTQPQAKDEKKKTTKSSISTKRSRADTHNQSERKRRETINQKMRTLQKMVPNSNKTDKASMLDEVIDYLKQLQAQVHMMMMGRMGIPFVTMPYAMPQNPFQMPLVPSMGMGMDMNMNMNIINSAIMAAGLPPVMPTAPWDVSAGRPPSSSNMGPSAHCQTQPMTMEAYNMMAALIQQQQQQQLASTTPKN